MATQTSQQVEQSQRPAWVAPVAVLVVAGAVLVGLLYAFKQVDAAIDLVQSLVIAIGQASPVIVPAGVAWAIPKEHGIRVRAVLAIFAGLAMFFLTQTLPGTVGGDGQPHEAGHLLSWLLGLPLAGAVGVLFLPRQSPRAIQLFTMIVMLASFGVALPLLGVHMGATYHFNQDVVWMPRFGIHYHVAIDGISLWLVMLTVFIVPIAAYASFGSIKTRMKDWCFALLLLEGAMLGAFVALDLFVFYIFWELMLVPMYVMIGVWGGTDRIRSAIKFFLYTMTGSMLMLGAILYLAYTYAKASGGQLSFDYFDLQRLVLPQHVQTWLFAAFALSFLIKVPMWPLHTWLPDAHTEAPTGGSIILAAVMLKLGTYGYLRFCLGLFPEASAWAAAMLAGVAVLGGIIYGALCAWKQDDVKRLIAYSSVAHLGYVMLGIFACTQGSLEGAVLQMVNHGISTGALFLLFGMLYDRRHTRQADDFGGLAKVMPVYTALFVIVTLASVGLPTTNGFIGEFMIITSTFASTKIGKFNGIDATGAAIGVILGAVYMLGVVQKVFFGPLDKTDQPISQADQHAGVTSTSSANSKSNASSIEANKHLEDINSRELLAVAPLVIMIFVIGLFPNIFLTQIKDAAQRVDDDMTSHLEAHHAPDYYEGAIKLAPRSSLAPRALPAAPPPADASL